MQQQRFESLMEATFQRVREMNATKGADYAPDADALAHLRGSAAELDLPLEIVWAVHARKHWMAVTTYCRKGDVSSEPIESRLLDLILYAILLLAIQKDSEGMMSGGD